MNSPLCCTAREKAVKTCDHDEDPESWGAFDRLVQTAFPLHLGGGYPRLRFPHVSGHRYDTRSRLA